MAGENGGGDPALMIGIIAGGEALTEAVTRLDAVAVMLRGLADDLGWHSRGIRAFRGKVGALACDLAEAQGCVEQQRRALERWW